MNPFLVELALMALPANRDEQALLGYLQLSHQRKWVPPMTFDLCTFEQYEMVRVITTSVEPVWAAEEGPSEEQTRAFGRALFGDHPVDSVRQLLCYYHDNVRHARDRPQDDLYKRREFIQVFMRSVLVNGEGYHIPIPEGVPNATIDAWCRVVQVELHVERVFPRGRFSPQAMCAMHITQWEPMAPVERQTAIVHFMARACETDDQRIWLWLHLIWHKHPQWLIDMPAQALETIKALDMRSHMLKWWFTSRKAELARMPRGTVTAMFSHVTDPDLYKRIVMRFICEVAPILTWPSIVDAQFIRDLVVAIPERYRLHLFHCIISMGTAQIENPSVHMPDGLVRAILRRLVTELFVDVQNRLDALQMLLENMGCIHMSALVPVTFGPLQHRAEHMILHHNERIECRAARVALQRIVIADEAARDADDPRACIACMTNVRRVCFEPCGHVVTCAACFGRLPEPRVCPTCRSPIARGHPCYL